MWNFDPWASQRQIWGIGDGSAIASLPRRLKNGDWEVKSFFGVTYEMDHGVLVLVFWTPLNQFVVTSPYHPSPGWYYIYTP